MKRQPRGGTLHGRVLTLVATLLLLLIAVAMSTIATRLRVQNADRRVNHVLIPAQDAAFRMEKAWLDQETGERGFLLTGDPRFLQPYDAGAAAATATADELLQTMRGDARVAGLVRDVEAAGTAWQQQSAVPEITARAAGRSSSSPSEVVAQTERAKQLFDLLRARLDALTAYLNTRVADQLSRAHDAQTFATLVAVVAVGLALAAAAAAVLVMRFAFAAPVRRLLAQVQQVAAGRLDQPVQANGPSEVAAIASAVEAMRTRILRDTEEAAQTRELLAKHAEDDRIARDLHDLVIQRLFGAGMRLESAAARHPEAAHVFRDIVDELDRSIRELRTVIFGLTAMRGDGGLRERVMAMLRDGERSLGFRPSLVVNGPVDSVADEAVSDNIAALLTEILSNTARHAHATSALVTLEVVGDALRLEVSDNGVGLPDEPDGAGRGLRNLVSRAEGAGGSCDIRSGAGVGTTVDVRLPLERVVAL